MDEAAAVCREGLTLFGRRGIEAPALADLQRTILRRQVPATSRPAPVVPSLLPPAPPRFVSRRPETEQILRYLDAHEPVLVTGPAGVGKTSLAVHIGHCVASRYPDGQLFVNLRGFDPVAAAMSPAEAVRELLDGLQVPAHRVPPGPAGQLALYRSLLSGRRTLEVLDNARDAEQVRPLLPGAPGCGVLITSRDQLPSLVAVDGAQPVTVDLFSAEEAGHLLARRLGEERLGAEPDAVGEIVRCCAGLPLALAIVAARAATNPGLPLAVLAKELASGGRDLEGFASADTAIDVRGLFSCSYRTLSPPAARMFRLLGLHPGPHVSASAAASLAAVPVAAARTALAELTRAHMVAHAADRYTMHDLLRAYAAELAARMAGGERDAALARMLDHYLHTAHAAERLLEQHWEGIELPPPASGTTVDGVTDYPRAMDWFTVEHPVLLAAVRLAADRRLDRYTWQLAWTLGSYQNVRGRWADQITCCTLALAAAERLADPAAAALAHTGLGMAHARLGREEDAYRHRRCGLDLYRKLGDQAGQARMHLGLGWLVERGGDLRAAVEHDRRAVALFRAAGHRSGQARALNSVGWDHVQLGDHQQAITYCRQSLALHEEIGDRQPGYGAGCRSG